MRRSLSSEISTLPQPRRVVSACLLAAAIVVCLTGTSQAEDGAIKPAVEAGPFSLDRVDQIYIPADLLESVIDRDGNGSVLLSRSEFEKLLATARSAVPVGGADQRIPVLGASRYDARINSGRLEVDAELAVTTQSPASTLDFAIGNWNIESAKLGDEPATLGRMQNKSDQVRLFLPEPGTHLLKLKLSTALQVSGSDQLARLALLNGSSGEIQLRLPEGKSLLVNGLQVTRPAPLDQPADYVVPVGGLTQLEIRVTDRTQSARTDSLTFANTVYGIRILPGEVSWSTSTQLDVYGRQIDQLICSIPRQLEITGVQSEGLESWLLEDDESRPTVTRLKLKYRTPFDGNRQIAIQGILSPALGQPWDVPQLVLQDVTTHTGLLLIWQPEQIRLQTIQQAEARAVPVPKRAGQLMADQPTLAYEVWRDDFTLQFLTSLKDSPLQAAISQILLIEETGLRLLSTVTLEPRRAPVFDVRLRVPAGLRIESVSAAGSPLTWEGIPADAGLQDLKITLPVPLKPGESLTLSMEARQTPEQWPIKQTPVTIPFLAARLMNTDMVEVLYGVCAPQMLEVAPLEVVGLEAASGVDLALLSQRVQQVGAELRLGFSGQELTYQGQLQITRRPGTVNVDTVSLFEVDRETVSTHLVSRLSVAGGGLRTLTVEVSEEAGDQVRFTLHPANDQAVPAMLIEQVPGNPMEGRRPWLLTFDRLLQGDYFLRTLVSLPRGTATEFSPVKVSFPQATSQSGALAISAQEDEEIRIVAQGAGGLALQVIDPIDFPAPSTWPTNRLVAGYRYAQPGWNVQVSVVPFTRAPVPSAIGQELNLTSLWESGSEVQHLARLKFQAVGMQSLVVNLPEHARLWSALVDQSPVEIRHSGQSLLVSLSPLASNASHELKLLYSTAPASTEDEFRAAAPEFFVTTGRGDNEPLTVLSQSWDLHYPEDLLVLDVQSEYQPAKPLTAPTWTARLWDQLSHLKLSHTVLAACLLVFVGSMLAMISLLALRPLRATMILGVVLLTGILVAGGMYLTVGQIESTLVSSTSSDKAIILRDESARMPDALIVQSPSPTSLAIEGSVLNQAPALPKAPAPAAPTSAAPTWKDSTPHVEPKSTGPQQGNAAEKQMSQGGGMGGGVDVLPDPERSFGSDFNDPSKQNGMLSLSAALRVPADMQHLNVSYRGNHPPGAGLPLQVRLTSKSNWSLMLLAIAFGVALLGWWLRNANRQVAATWLFLTLIVPLALLPFQSPWLDLVTGGVLLGGLFSLILMVARQIIEWLISIRAKVWECCENHSVKALMLLSILCHGTEQLEASEPVPPARAATVVVPYTSLESIPTSDRVLVPADLYKQIWSMANPNSALSAEEGATAFISEAIYRAEPSEQAKQQGLAVSARWVAVNPTASPLALELPIRGVQLSRLMVGDAPAPVEVNAQGVPTLILKQRGVQIVDAQFTLPLEMSADAGQFRFETTPVGSGVWTVLLNKAAEPRRIRVNGSGSLFRSNVTGDREEIQIPIDRGGTVLVSWQPERQPMDQNSVTQFEAVTQVTVSDVGLTQSVKGTLIVRQGMSGECRFKLPAKLAIQKITGPDVAGWEVSASADEGREVKVLFRRQVQDRTEFELELFQPLDLNAAQQSITVDLLEPLGMNRETGSLALICPKEFRLNTTELIGLQQVDVKAFPAVRPPLPSETHTVLCYRYSSRPIGLTFSLERAVGEVRATAQHGIRIGLKKVSFASRVILDVQDRPRRQFEFRLPEGYLPLEVVCANCTDWFVTNGENERRLTIELDRPTLGRVEIGLDGRMLRTQAPQPVSLTVPVPAVDRQTHTLGVSIDAAEQATLSSSTGWTGISPQELPPAIRNLGSEVVQFAFRSSDSAGKEAPGTLTFNLVRQTPDLQADAAVLIVAGDATVDYGMTFRWRITNSKAEKFAVSVPSWLGPLDFQGEGIRQIRSEPGDAGQTRWIITTLEPARDQMLISAAATIALPADQIIQTPAIRFLTMTGPNPFAELMTQQQFAVLVNRSPNQIMPASAGAIEKLSVEELPLNLPEDLIRQAMEIVRIREGQLPAWRVELVQRVESARAIVLSANLTTLLQGDGSWRTRAVYGVRNRGQQFLAVAMPDDASILSVVVKGAPSRTVLTQIDGKPLHLVPLPQTSAADLSFDVVLVLAGQLPHALPSPRSLRSLTVELPAPDVLSPKNSPEYGVSTAQTIWNVYVPDGLKAVPAENTGATNVVWHRGSGWVEAESMSLKRARMDLQELSRIVTGDSYSIAQRGTAISNLKELQSRLESQQSFIPGRQAGDADTDRLLRENNALMEEVAKATSSDQPYSSSRPQESAPGTQNRALIRNLNESVQMSNSFGTVQQQMTSPNDGEYSFYVPISDQFRNRSSSKGEEIQSRAGLKSKLQSQAPLANNQQTGEGEQPQLVEQERRSRPMSDTRRKTLDAKSQETQLGYSNFNAYDPFRQGSFDLVAPTFGGPDPNNLLGVSPVAPPAEAGVVSQPSPQWGSSGGLSLAVDLPVSGNELSFSRVGGAPKLSLIISSADRWTLIPRLCWAGLWVVAGFWLLRTSLLNATPIPQIQLGLRVLALLGAAGFLLVPGPAGWAAFVVFLGASITALAHTWSGSSVSSSPK